jgi:hypothetical protein
LASVVDLVLAVGRVWSWWRKEVGTIEERRAGAGEAGGRQWSWVVLGQKKGKEERKEVSG